VDVIIVCLFSEQLLNSDHLWALVTLDAVVLVTAFALCVCVVNPGHETAVG